MSSLELPVLRFGLAGFSPEQERAIEAAAAASRITRWTGGALAGADVWFINGQCAQHLGDGRIRVASRQAGGRSIQLQLAEARRPLAFAKPLPTGLAEATSFDAADPHSILEAIGVFEFTLAATAAQFLLAGQIVDHQEVLGAGTFELRARGQLIAVVDMQGEACVLPSARPANFEAGMWAPVQRGRMRVPANFARVNLGQMMWRYASRSARDLLPERYRKRRIFFRRPPRIDPVLVDEEHLLVMREVAFRPSTFEELKVRLGVADDLLARALAALYYVGSITTNPSRAGTAPSAGEDSGVRPVVAQELADLRQLTAPAPVAAL